MNNLEKAYVVSADVLSLTTQLSSSGDLPSFEVLQRRLESLFEQMAAKGRELGIADTDLADMRYALVAFVDEQLLKSPWPGREQWMGRPLQLVYYGENTAGEGFFTKMDQLTREPSRAIVLEVFFLCLSLGFQGVYAVRADKDALNAMVERSAALLGRTLPSADVISPNGRATEVGRGRGKVDAPLIALGAACLVAAVGAFIVLRIVLASEVSSTTDRIEKLQQSVATTSHEGR